MLVSYFSYIYQLQRYDDIHNKILPRFCSVELVNLTSLELVSPPWPPPFLFNIELALGTCFDDFGGTVVVLLLATTAAGLLEHAPILLF